jgi:hypothetical protein
MSKALVCSAAAIVLAWATSSADAQWGSIKGKVVIDEVPTLKPLIAKGDPAGIAKDPAVCAAQDVPDESLVVDEKTKGVANVVIYLRKKPEKADQIHPKFQNPEAATVLYDQMGCKFIPHIALVQTNQKLRVVSGDPIAHNTRGSPLKNMGFNFIVKPSDREGTDIPFKIAENQPIEVTCDIHRWMKGYLLIVDHPYSALTKADGTFEITDLPPGELEFRAWQERVGYVSPTAGERSFKVKVTAGKATEVPTIKLTAKALLEAK